MKKLLAMLLALAMVLSLAACGGNDAEPTAAPTENNGATDSTQAAADPNATYTYNTALTVFPTGWNPHTSETQTDREILDYISRGMYAFDYNETGDGYVLEPCTAAADPVDVTSEYIGQFGLEEGAANRAWKVTLRDDLKWEDGTPITAVDYVESYKRLLAPEAQNYRADGMYTGNMVIHGAENYLKQGLTVHQDNSTSKEEQTYKFADLKAGDDGVFLTPNGEKVFVALDMGLTWLDGETLKNMVEAYGADYFDVTNWDALVAKMDANGMVPLTQETYDWLVTVVAGNPAWGETEDNAPCYFAYEKQYPEYAWEEVGILAPSEKEVVFVLDKPLSGFYLLYNLTDSYLVKVDLYDSLAKVENGVYTNSYGTSAETTASFGPYKLVSFQADKQYVFERNENYFDLDGKYQATKWVVDFVPEASTRLELFTQGKLDSYGLSADDMETYSLSDYCYYATGDSTFAMVFNPDASALEASQKAAGANINKTILTLTEFRQAMSFAMDRKNFCLATSPTNNAAYGLYSTKIVADPDAGLSYRNTEVSKKVLAEFWGVSEEYGEGKLYADLDEAVDSITGYNLDKAKQLFDAAYDKAIAEGLMDEDDVVEIKIGTPNSTSQFYNNGYEYIVNNYTEAVKGTKLEGKLTFSRDDTLGNGFADALKNNQVDMLFGVGWTGSTFDPYGLIEAYIMPAYQYDDCIDYTKIDVTVAIDGVDYTASAMDWYNVMSGVPTTVTAADGTKLENYSCGNSDGDPATRLEILGALERSILMNYTFIPVMDESQAQLRGQQINYKTEEDMFPMGFGGIEYYTFEYTDAEWDEYVAANGGKLDYT